MTCRPHDKTLILPLSCAAAASRQAFIEEKLVPPTVRCFTPRTNGHGGLPLTQALSPPGRRDDAPLARFRQQRGRDDDAHYIAILVGQIPGSKPYRIGLR